MIKLCGRGHIVYKGKGVGMSGIQIKRWQSQCGSSLAISAIEGRGSFYSSSCQEFRVKSLGYWNLYIETILAECLKNYCSA